MKNLDQASEIRKGEELDQEKLKQYFKNNVTELSEILEIKQFAGGYSNLTYLIKTPQKEYVLRKAPAGAAAIKGGHNMKREFGILDALKNADFKQIPTPIHFCEDESIVGSEFYIMEKVVGSILRTSQLKNIKDELSENRMHNLSIELCKAQAELHKIDIYASKLDQLGKPQGYIKRQVNGWHERYLNSKTDDVKNMKSVYEWLSNNIPVEIKPSLIHNDYKYDNVVLDLEKEEILAILDWEMTTIGDPRMDLGTTLSYWAESGDQPFEKNFNLTWLPGNLKRTEYIAEYQKINPIDLKDILFFFVFGLFKNAVIIQQIYARYKKGLTNDPRFEHLNLGVLRLSEKANQSILSKEMK